MVASLRVMDNDARYERPCKWILAVAAGIHWVAAALVISSDLHVGNQFVGHYARGVQELVNAILPALT